MEQENRNQQNAAPQVSIGDQIKVRREKLAQLQAEGMDPFAITRFVSTTTAQEIKDHFDEMEGKPVSIAGRLMSKRGQGVLLRSAGQNRPHPALRPQGRNGRGRI